MNSRDLLKNLPPDSIAIETVTQLVRLDDEPESAERCYLQIAGTPESFSWLSNLLAEMASEIGNQDTYEPSARSVTISPHDLDQVSLAHWDAIELTCR
ncbi:MAG: hypothetical protein AAF456_17150 [Planctomycetota bacterium]